MYAGRLERKAAPLKTHKARPEGGSLCVRGRRSYQLTEDESRVTCPGCLGIMKESKK